MLLLRGIFNNIVVGHCGSWVVTEKTAFPMFKSLGIVTIPITRLQDPSPPFKWLVDVQISNKGDAQKTSCTIFCLATLAGFGVKLMEINSNGCFTGGFIKFKQPNRRYWRQNPPCLTSQLYSLPVVLESQLHHPYVDWTGATPTIGWIVVSKSAYGTVTTIAVYTHTYMQMHIYIYAFDIYIYRYVYVRAYLEQRNDPWSLLERTFICTVRFQTIVLKKEVDLARLPLFHVDL